MSIGVLTRVLRYQAVNPIPSNAVKCSEKPQRGIHTITGEIWHVKGANLLIKKTDGEEVLLLAQEYGQVNT
jgi:hypothetical protein